MGVQSRSAPPVTWQPAGSRQKGLTSLCTSEAGTGDLESGGNGGDHCSGSLASCMSALGKVGCCPSDIGALSAVTLRGADSPPWGGVCDVSGVQQPVELRGHCHSGSVCCLCICSRARGFQQLLTHSGRLVNKGLPQVWKHQEHACCHGPLSCVSGRCGHHA